jgi:hypothetical protein
MLDLGICYFYLGIEVIRNHPRRIFRFSQETYLRKIFSDHGMENCYNIKTLIETSSRFMLTEPSYKTDPAFRKVYQSIIGSFIYIILGIRPNIVYIVSVISRFSANPIEAYISIIKRVFRYLKDILFVGLVFRGEF